MELLSEINQFKKEAIEKLSQETNELIAIFVSSINTVKQKLKN